MAAEADPETEERYVGYRTALGRALADAAEGSGLAVSACLVI